MEEELFGINDLDYTGSQGILPGMEREVFELSKTDEKNSEEKDYYPVGDLFNQKLF